MVPRSDQRFTAVTREVSPAFERCELTHLARAPIDLDAARAHHRAYERCLTELGCSVVRLPADADQPDSVFIEDTAIVFDECAVVTRPGAASRRGEVAAVDTLLRRYRAVRRIEAPGTLDGGDVLRVGKRVFVGRSSRSNDAAVEQLRDILGTFGYSVSTVAVHGCLHLKSAVTALADDVLLVNRQWLATGELPDFELLDVAAGEPFAANALRIGETVLCATAFPGTRRLIEARGFAVRMVEMGEMAKAEGGVTCCSLIFR